MTTILVLIIGGLLFWTLQRKGFKPYRWAWAFGIAQALCGFADWLLDLHLSRLWLALCVGWAVFACLGYMTEYIDKAISDSQLGKSKLAREGSLEMSKALRRHRRV